MEFELTTARRQLHIAVTLITVILLTTVPSFVLGYPNDSGKLQSDGLLNTPKIAQEQCPAVFVTAQLLFRSALFFFLLLLPFFLAVSSLSFLTSHLLHSTRCSPERHSSIQAASCVFSAYLYLSICETLEKSGL